MLKPHRPLRVAVLCSHRAPGLLYLLNRAPERGSAFEIVCCVTSSHTFAEEVRVERRGVPTFPHPIQAFYAARGAAVCHDPAIRAEYDAQTLRLVEPYFPDILLLDGYLFMITAPLLKAFPRRAINLHFADLTRRLPDGRPQFPGIRAVRDALAAGCADTRATVHVVNAEPDDGPPIVCSWPFPVSPLVAELATMNAADVIKAYVYAHQQWMMRTASGPLIAAALQLIASGAVDLDALSAAGHDASSPWRLDRDGSLLAPDREPAFAGARR
jgi:phosphoribosylglycinamide formyltransferase-1